MRNITFQPAQAALERGNGMVALGASDDLSIALQGLGGVFDKPQTPEEKTAWGHGFTHGVLIAGAVLATLWLLKGH